MEGSYAVYLGDRPAGKLQIIKEGLYYRIVCRCQVPDAVVYRLYAVTDKGRENLGVVIPTEDGCMLERKISAKQLQEGACFRLSSRSDTEEVQFVPVYPEEPFSYIAQLETAFLEVRERCVGVCWKKGSGAE